MAALTIATGTGDAANSRKTVPHVYDVRPAVVIPIGPLGYLPPGEFPSFHYHAAVSLHFIDATHLLFAFSYPGLLRRDDNCSFSDSQRMVRAVVLDIPSGRIEKQTNWQLYDFSDFLWGIGQGEFLLRRCTRIDTVGVDLVPRPLISAAGPIEGVTFSPDRSIAVIETKLPSTRKSSLPEFQEEDRKSLSGHNIDVSFVRLRPLRVIAHTRLPIPADLPVLSRGVLETLTAPGNRWIMNLHGFSGKERQIGVVQSYCMPALKALSENVFVAEICPTKKKRLFQAFDLSGKSLWTIPLNPNRHNVRFLLTENGKRFAIETLHATQPLAALDPLNKSDIDVEIVEIYDTQTGIEIGRFATTPIYTAGQNASFSPDGLKMAVIHHGAIEIYSLNQLAKYRLNLNK